VRNQINLKKHPSTAFLRAGDFSAQGTTRESFGMDLQESSSFEEGERFHNAGDRMVFTRCDHPPAAGAQLGCQREFFYATLRVVAARAAVRAGSCDDFQALRHGHQTDRYLESGEADE